MLDSALYVRVASRHSATQSPTGAALRNSDCLGRSTQHTSLIEIRHESQSLAYCVCVDKRYGKDVLGLVSKTPVPILPVCFAEIGLVLECPTSGWVGAIVELQKGPEGWAVCLEDRKNRRKMFLLTDPLLLDGQRVRLVRPGQDQHASAPTPSLTASGSIAIQGKRASIARGSRIWVEGKQDAELVEKIWGDDLRVEGIVVEELGGVDELLAAVQRFAPTNDFRLGILLDHLVPNSKEQRIADEVNRAYPQHVLILGHPYIDVWQAVRPSTLSIQAWPVIPQGQDWKTGICRDLGWNEDTSATWRSILSKVTNYADLEPSLLGRVEELIDFVTQ